MEHAASAAHSVEHLNLWWVLLAPAFPALGFAALVFLSRRMRNMLRFVPLVCLSISLCIAVAADIVIWPGGHIGEAFYSLSWTLGTLGGVPLTMSFAVDSLSVLMLAMVSIVGLGVQTYSLFYMKNDERVGWFFCVLSLFLAAMLGFVLSGSLLLQFALWEIMGVCSYSLIGFWYREEAPRKASQKAFLFTRAGDVGFFIALAAIFAACQSFEFATIFETAGQWSPLLLAVACLGLVWAAIGKSAQFPLSAWLPDAMAGPTPGSALIHAATMVVAGVFMLIRMLPVLALYPVAMNIILIVGVVTALYGGLLACFQNDLKRVLAFSTISQLGFLFAAIGVNEAVVSVFHMTTHAFFKSLLFLAAGIIIHSTHTQDMRQMGGLARRMPITFAIFTIGAFALAGVIPLSGFFSKDEIFYVLLHYGQETGQYWAFAGIVIVGVLTAFYVAKSWFTVFFGNVCNIKAHEGSPLELGPVSVLAFLAATTGFLVIPLGRFLGHEGHWPSPMMVAISTGVMLVGAVLGFFAYSRRQTVRRLGKVFHLVVIAADRRFYLDWFYDTLIIRPYFWLSDALWRLDAKLIDGVVNGVVWLYGRVSPIIWRFDNAVIDGFVNASAWLYRAATTVVWRIDHSLIDGIVNASAWLYVRCANFVRWFDLRVVDGVVNGLGTVSLVVGSRFSRLQIGRVQRYQRLVLGAGIVVVGVFVIVYMYVLKGA